MADDERPRIIVPASVRSLGAPDPLGQPARATVAPNANEPIGSVGPNVPTAGDASSQEGASGGYGATHAVYDAGNPPPAAMAWAGWPSEWATPIQGGRHWQGGGSDIVWAAISLNAQTIADMPPVVTTGGRRRNPQPAWVANPAPKIYTHWQEFLRQAVTSYYATGEIFAVVTARYADGYPASWMMVDPWVVNVELDNGVRSYSINGVDANGDVLHVRYSSWPGDARGHGPLEVAGERILAVQTLMRYGSDIAANPQPWGILKSKYQLTKDQSDELKYQWISAARSRNGAPAILGADLDLTLSQVTPKDMTLADLQKFAEARIAVLLGVPPYILGLPSGADSLTYSNVQSIFEFWYRSSLKATKDYLAQAISAWALPAGTNLELNESSFTQPGPLERAQYYELGLRDGWLTVDEVRAAEKLSPDGLSALSEDPAPDPAVVV
jgi:HK97 family phage portal protein